MSEEEILKKDDLNMFSKEEEEVIKALKNKKENLKKFLKWQKSGKNKKTKK